MGGKNVVQIKQKFLERSEKHDLQSSKYDPNPNPKTAGCANAGNGIILNLQIFELKVHDLVKQAVPRDGRQVRLQNTPALS